MIPAWYMLVAMAAILIAFFLGAMSASTPTKIAEITTRRKVNDGDSD